MTPNVTRHQGRVCAASVPPHQGQSSEGTAQTTTFNRHDGALKSVQTIRARPQSGEFHGNMS